MPTAEPDPGERAGFAPDPFPDAPEAAAGDFEGPVTLPAIPTGLTPVCAAGATDVCDVVGVAPAEEAATGAPTVELEALEGAAAPTDGADCVDVDGLELLLTPPVFAVDDPTEVADPDVLIGVE